jgi:hypothetical protein
MSTTQGRSLELFFIDGKPDGMLTAQVFNWTGHVLMTPRTKLNVALARKESGYSGVYILLGEKDGEQFAYIGESENVSYRIKNHDSNRDWWTTAVVITASDNVLNKAHVKYLEARLIEQALDAAHTKLENGNVSARPTLTEAQLSNMEVFLENVLMVLPAIRVDLFVKNTRVVPLNALPVPNIEAVEFELVGHKHGTKAIAYLDDGEFVVEIGSMARSEWVGKGSADGTYARLYAELKRQGVLVEQGDSLVFTKSYAFASPSAAAAVVNGRNANGTTEWVLKGTDTTYKEWEAALLAKTGDEAP